MQGAGEGKPRLKARGGKGRFEDRVLGTGEGKAGLRTGGGRKRGAEDSGVGKVGAEDRGLGKGGQGRHGGKGRESDRKQKWGRECRGEDLTEIHR